VTRPTPPATPAGPLTADDTAELLGRPILARLATIDDDGHPAIVPVWFEWVDGSFWVIARARARYVAHVAARPQVGLSIVDERDPDRRIQVRGRATVVDGPGPLEGPMLALARRLAERYEGESGLAYVEASRAWPRVLIRIEALATLTWGSPDWHDRYRGRPHEEDR
jgi:PPOX class probable F420-dependent enzyme